MARRHQKATLTSAAASSSIEPSDHPAMPSTLRYFMLPEDELALFRLFSRQALTVYPEIVPPGYQAPLATEDLVPRLEASAYYLAAERFGAVVVHPVKRGPDKGLLEVEEIPSPVFHYERSLPNQEGELVGGRLWAELDVDDDLESRTGKPIGLRNLFEEVHRFFRKSWRRSQPKGWWIGPRAAAAWKSQGLVLREPGHRGGLVGAWR